MPVNIGDNRVVEPGIARVSPDDADRLFRHRCRPGDIVYSRRGDVERRALIREHERGWLCGTGCLRVRVGEHGAHAEYVSFMLGHPRVRAWITQHAVGATMPNLNTAILSATPAVLPPIPEQRAIAGVLGALDDKIESNRSRAATVHILLDLLSSAYGDLPPTALRELVEVDRVPWAPAPHGAAFVDLFSLPAFDSGQLPDRTPARTIMSNKFLIRTESVLLSRLNPGTNRTWFAAPNPGITAAASTEFLVLRPVEALGVGALWLAVRDEFFRSELVRRATGTSGSHQRVRPDDALAIEVPDVRLLEPATSTEAEGLLRLAHQARIESATLAELRDALLPELLSGRLRVPVAEEIVGDAT
ncbi:MAG: restriction endonuclease subunit S [Pseudonocardiaceae bacterium]